MSGRGMVDIAAYCKQDRCRRRLSATAMKSGRLQQVNPCNPYYPGNCLPFHVAKTPPSMPPVRVGPKGSATMNSSCSARSSSFPCLVLVPATKLLLSATSPIAYISLISLFSFPFTFSSLPCLILFVASAFHLLFASCFNIPSSFFQVSRYYLTNSHLHC